MCKFLCVQELNVSDGSLSDTAVGQLHVLEAPQKESSSRKESQRDRERERQAQFVGLSKKSNSTSQLSATGKANEQHLTNTLHRLTDRILNI